MIDYLTLMLVNMAAGLAMLACYVAVDLNEGNPKRWVAGFAAVGAIATACGLHMTWTWPIIGAYNMAFGEMSVMLGILFLGAALSFAKGWDLLPMGIYAFFAGLAAVLIGFKMGKLGMTAAPTLTAVGYVLTGAAGVCVLPGLYLRRYAVVRYAGALLLAVAALIWARTGYLAYLVHLESSAKYVPPTMQ